MLVKIIIVGAIAIGAMAAIRDGRILRDAGLLSRCSAVAANGRSEANEMSCSKGRLDGWPNLSNRSCDLVAVSPSRQIWRCVAPVVSSQSPNG